MTSPLGISIDDGLMDIAFTNALNLTVWFGNGRGGFTVGPTAPISFSDSYLMLGDFDGDGRADLAIGEFATISTACKCYTEMGQDTSR